MGDDTLRLLIPRELAARLDRRRFLGATWSAALGLGVAACGRFGVGGGRDRGTLSIYTWAEYHDPRNTAAFESSHAIDVSFDIFESNEAMLAKLELAGTSAGYDLVVPSSEFLPQMVRRGLLRELDTSRLPNLRNQDPRVVALKNSAGGDPDGRYSAIKTWGATGYVYDRSVIAEELTDWADFFRAAAAPRVSGLVSLLTSPAEIAGLVFWRDDIDWLTTDPGHLDHAETVLLREMAPHVKAFDAYPGLGMLAGEYVLSQAWSGDARKAVVEDPERYRWVFPTPKTNLFIDTWAILSSAPHPETAHAWIDFILQPEVSAREIAFTGMHTGVLGVEAHLPGDLPARQLIFFTDEEMGRLVPAAVNEAQDRLVEIFNTLRVAASRA